MSALKLPAPPPADYRQRIEQASRRWNLERRRLLGELSQEDYRRQLVALALLPPEGRK